MAIIKCSKGHYYDNTKFSQCPHCGVLPIMEQEQQQEAKPKRFSFFHRPEGKKQEAVVPAPYMEEEDDDHTVAMPVAPGPFLAEDDEDDDHTIAMPRMQEPVREEEPDEDDDHTIAMPKVQEPVREEEPDEDDDHTIAIPKMQEPVREEEPDEDDDRTIAIPKMQEMVREEEPDEDDDRTIAIPKMQETAGREEPEEAGGRTMATPKRQEAAPQVAEEKQPGFVAGWLVCVNGPERGCDYRLYKGFNRLGNGERTDILVRDPGLAAVAVAVVYDDRSNAFFAVQQPGAQALLNGEELEGAVRISSGDLIKAGESEFEFVAFCREGRVWDSYE
ncbi:MAG: hypothetical protein HFG59_02175 [Lachnospiraceae bacterium]|nr:hypothetical protein [Lachnospiraceae bacterium]